MNADTPDRNAAFFTNMLTFMRYPDLESSHQVLLAAALHTRLDLVKNLVASDTDSQRFGEWAGPQTFLGRERQAVEVEHTPPGQPRGPRKSRFDILVMLKDATVIVECKWRASTDLGQLTRYAKLLKQRPGAFPNPVIVLVSVDGEPPAEASKLYDALKVPLRFVSWEVVGEIIRAVAEDIDPHFVATLRQAHEGLAGFATVVCGDEAIPPRGDGDAAAADASKSALDDDDEDDDARPVEAKGTRLGFSDPTVPERFALSRLATAVIAALAKRGLGPWQVSMPPTVGARGDVQCDLAPAADTSIERAAPADAAEALKALGCAQGWLIELGRIRRPEEAGPAADAFSKVADACGPAAGEPTEVRLHQRLALRLYFTPGRRVPCRLRRQPAAVPERPPVRPPSARGLQRAERARQ